MATSAGRQEPLPMHHEQHAYLGELEDVEHAAQSYFPEGATVKLPLVVLPDIVLFPGDELPLRMLLGTTMDALREQLQSDGAVLAVVCAHQESDVAYGTTVRIEKFSVREGAVTGAAKQRFRVASSVLWRTRAQLADVEILPHPAVHRLPLERRCTRGLPPALARVQRRQQSVGYWSHQEYAQFDVRRLVARIQRTFASSAQWAWFCYASAHPERVAQQQSQQRQRTSTAATSSTLHYLQQSSDELDPCAFAYWVAGNLPLERSERLALLQLGSVTQLLRAELALLHQGSDAILCSGCGATLAHTRDIFSLTSAGAAGTFVNPSGIVFQILTLRAVATPSVVVDNVQSTQDSWYPGYAWSIAYCSSCFRHLGWQFDAVERADDAAPTRFFGFRRAALTQAFTGRRGGGHGSEDEDEDEEDYSGNESDASSRLDEPSDADESSGVLVAFDTERGSVSSGDDLD